MHGKLFDNTRLSITPSENVGIGYTSPRTKLDVRRVFRYYVRT